MSITSANATFFISIAGLFPAPQQLFKFAADEVFDTDPIEAAEVQMGVDGYKTAGFVFVPVKQGISLMADSPSAALFDQWYAAQQTARDVFNANGTIYLPTLGTKWAMINGTLTTYPPLPNARKVLQPRKFGVTWERVSPAVI